MNSTKMIFQTEVKELQYKYLHITNIYNVIYDILL